MQCEHDPGLESHGHVPSAADGRPEQRYTKLRLVGSGTFGTAWLVRSRSGKQYVMKVFNKRGHVQNSLFFLSFFLTHALSLSLTLASAFAQLKDVNVSIMSGTQRSQALNEVSILKQLRHANIVKYREAFCSEGVLHICMEYAAGLANCLVLLGIGGLLYIWVFCIL